MKQFPLDFNESNFIIHNFSKLSRRKRISASEDRLTDIATTEYSKENCETNKSTNSEGNYSDNFNDFYINPHIRSKVYLEETKMYDPERDSDNSQIARTKQKVYVKYEKLKQRSYSDSSCSEESDTDDPIRKMLKSNIHKIYEANDDQLYSQSIKIKEMQEFQTNYGSYNYEIYNNPRAPFTPQSFTDIVQHFSQMISSYYCPDPTFLPYESNQSFDRMNYDNNW